MKYDKVMMQTAIAFSEESYANKLKVGAVLAKDGRILVTGYNGTISGLDNKCEYEEYTCIKCKSSHVDLAELIDYGTLGSKIVYKCKTCKHTVFYSKYSLSDRKPKIDFNYIKMHVPDDFKKQLITSDFVLHAEQNIITYAAKKGIPTENCTLYITHSPCKNCAKLIAQSGIKRVVYKEEYRDTSGIDFLKKCNIEVSKFNI